MEIKNNRDKASLFDGSIQKDEMIIWIGQPHPLRLLTLADIIWIPVSLLWGGFFLFMGPNALWGRQKLEAFWLDKTLFVIVGQYMIWGRFVYKYLERKNTYYALTERRALVLSTLFRKTTKTYLLSQFASFKRQGKSILFESRYPPPLLKRSQQGWAEKVQPGFYDLADADTVYTLMQDMLASTESINTTPH